MFSKVNSRVSFPDLERDVLRYWKEHQIFEKSEQGEDKALFMFYEGPPTANGSPGIHHVLARAFKDVICRYKTMKGFRPLRKGGWDTHGLPVELEVERELGLKSKRQIEEYGIAEFNEKCRESVFKYVKEWEDLTDRIGYWVDMKDPYVTLHNSYIETGWWILKEMWEKGLIYKGMKGTPHCPRCVSSLSSHEVALGVSGETRRTRRFTLSFLWRTRRDWRARMGIRRSRCICWRGRLRLGRCRGNTALAVDPRADYSLVEVERDGVKEGLILADALVDSVVGECRRVTEFQGVGVGWGWLREVV